MSYLGIIFALIALVSWGFGDFFIQRSAKKFGDWESLFIIALVGSILLFPFILSDLPNFSQFSTRDLVILLFVALSFFASAFINVEALRRGKLAVIESVGAIEIVVASILSFIVIGEKVALSHYFFIALLILGILLVALRPHHFRREAWLEKGAFLAFSGALIMGTTDFMVGFGSRTTNPILTVWIFNIVMLVITFLYLITSGRFTHFQNDLKSHRKLMVGVSILDNLAWLSFAISTLFVPIVVSLVLSESYIILATVLGIFLNRDKLQKHQIFGIIIAIIGVITLSIIYT